MVTPRFLTVGLTDWLNLDNLLHNNLLHLYSAFLGTQNSLHGRRDFLNHHQASSLLLLSTNKLVCVGRSGTLWLLSHHPSGCCTLVVFEEIPLPCKALWVPRKALYKCNKLLCNKSSRFSKIYWIETRLSLHFNYILTDGSIYFFQRTGEWFILCCLIKVNFMKDCW